MSNWSVTYETVTPESAEHGDADERGFVDESLSFRDAWDVFHSEMSGGYIEADSSPVRWPRCFTAYGEQDMRTCGNRNVSLHVPENITAASRMRLARLLGCYGL